MVLYDEQGKRLNLLEFLLAVRAGNVDQTIRVGAHHRLPARLLAVKVPAEVAAQRRKDLLAEASHKGQPVSTARLALADWVILVTNIPAALLTVEEAVVLYRVRWPVENAIDEVDTHLRSERPILRSQEPAGVVQEVYGILIAHYAVRKVIFEAAKQVAVDPDRISFVGALRLIRDALPELDAAPTEQARARRYAVLLADIGKELNPPRRCRSYPQVVKRKMSKFPLKRPAVHGRQLKTTPFLETVRIV